MITESCLSVNTYLEKTHINTPHSEKHHPKTSRCWLDLSAGLGPRLDDWSLHVDLYILPAETSGLLIKAEHICAPAVTPSFFPALIHSPLLHTFISFCHVDFCLSDRGEKVLVSWHEDWILFSIRLHFTTPVSHIPPPGKTILQPCQWDNSFITVVDLLNASDRCGHSRSAFRLRC